MIVPTNTAEWIPTVSLGDYDEFMCHYHAYIPSNEADDVLNEIETDYFIPHGTIVWRRKSINRIRAEQGVVT